MIARSILLRFLAVCAICSGIAVGLGVPANAATSASAAARVASTSTVASAGVYSIGKCHLVGQLLTIKVGASGSLVRFLQCLLIANHIRLPGGIDGYFGTYTQSAVRTYQSANRLTVDGVVGPQTWAAFVS
jgi:peptidoglycan hydrolase-like protein with peptidoglycan-binding domain